MFVLNVSGIGCGSCVSKITKAIQSLDSEATVSVDRAGKVSVESSESPEQVRKTVEALGFLPKSAPEALIPRWVRFTNHLAEL
jgi:copper chaperone